jgi:alpha-tubulin suppressor-like RCC1 family protein
MREIFNKSKIVKFSIICVLVSLLIVAGGCVFQSPPVNDSSNNGSPRFTSILSLGSTGLALRSDGRVVCWGHNDQGFCDDAQNITNAKSISYPNFVIKKDGKATTIGRVYGNKIPPNFTGVVEITRARLWNLALKDDGTLVAWSPYPGEPSKPVSDAQLAIIENQSALVSISGNLGLKKDGTVVAWGQTVIPDWNG